MGSKVDDFAASARANGYTWDDIHSYLNDKRSEANAAGYSNEDIDKYLGQGNPDAAKPAMKSQAQGLIDALPKPEGANPVMSYLDAYRASSGGLLIFGKQTADTVPPADNEFSHLAAMAGGVVGDLPVAAAGVVGGAAAGAAMTANPIGATIGGAMGGFALPQSIKSTYADLVKNGSIKSVGDYASRQAVIWHETADAAVTGAAMVAGGEVAAPLGGLAKLGGQVAAMTVASKALEGQLQDLKPEDFLDNAILLGAFKGVEAATKYAPDLRDQLLDHWVRTDEKPADAVALASIDEKTRQDLQQPPPPEYKKASVTPDLDGSGDLVIQKPPVQGVRASLAASTRPVLIKGMEGETVIDPHAAEILKSSPGTLDAIDKFLKTVGVEETKPLAGGASSVVLDAGDKVVRLGQGKVDTGQPDIPEVLKSISSAEINGIRVEVNPKVTTTGITDADVETMKATLAAKGYAWGDAGTDNLGRLPNGKLVVIDGRVTKTGEAPEATGKETSFNPLAPDYEADPAAARAAVLSRVAPPEPGLTLGEKVGNAWMDIRQQYLDKNAPVNDLEERIAEGRPIDSAQSPKVLREISRVSGERAGLMVNDGMIDFEGDRSGPGLTEILNPFKDDIDGFWAYAVSRWAVEKEAQGLETGVDINAAKAVVKGGHNQYEPSFNQLVDWQNGTLSYLHEAGILSDETFAKLVEENKARIPGYRAGKENNGGGQGFNPVKEFKGSELQVKDVLSSLVHDAFLRVELANAARYSTAVGDLGVEAGEAVEGPRTQAIKFDLNLDELERLGADQVAEGDSAIWRSINRTLAPDESMSVRDGKATIVKWDDPAIPALLRGYDQPTLSFLQKVVAGLTRVQKAMIVYDPTFPIRMKIYDIPQQFITNPGFSNPFFQFLEGFGHTVVRDSVWRDAVNRGVVHDVFGRVTRDAYTQNMMKGLEDPAFTTGIRNGLENAAKAPLRALKYWSSLFYQASEVGNMAARDRANPDKLRNAAEATQASFPQPGRSGSRTRLINQIQPFMTAYVNGIEQTAKAQLGIGSTVGGQKYSPVGFTLKALAAVTAPVLATYFLNKDKEWYKNTPDWQKDNGLLFPPVEPGGSPIFLKYPPVISFLYGALPRRIAEAIDAHDPGAMSKGVGQSFAWSFAPPGGLINYNIALPIVEKIANFSFHRGAPLNPAALSGPTGPMPAEQFTPYSTETAKTLAYGLSNLPLLRDFKLTPPEIDNFIHSWGGSIAPAVIQYGEQALGQHPELPTQHWEDLPGASSFFARNTGASAVPVHDFTDAMDKVAQVHASLGQLMANGDYARFSEMVKANPVAAAMLPPSFGTSVRGINAAGQAESDPRYIQAIQGAVAGLDRMGVGELMQTDNTMKLLRTLAGVVESAETPAGRQYTEELTGGTGVKGPLSPTDKRQLLDRIYGQMVVVAGRGNDQATQLGIKP